MFNTGTKVLSPTITTTALWFRKLTKFHWAVQYVSYVCFRSSIILLEKCNALWGEPELTTVYAYYVDNNNVLFCFSHSYRFKNIKMTQYCLAS